MERVAIKNFIKLAKKSLAGKDAVVKVLLNEAFKNLGLYMNKNPSNIGIDYFIDLCEFIAFYREIN